jgi:DNA-binding CsgD family transcriptional regulator
VSERATGGGAGRLRAGPHLVGRAGVLADLAAALDGRSDGPRLLALEGEAGTGKTSVLDAALDRASGRRVLRARADPMDADRPFAVAVRLLGTAPPADGASRSDRAGGPPGDTGAAPTLTVFDQLPDERHRIAHELRGRAEALAAEGPLLLVVDDVHWADPSTLWVLGSLVDDSAPALVVLVAGRPVADPSPAAAHLARRALESHGRFALGALDEDEVGELLDRLVEGTAGPGLRTWAARAAGNPMLVTELVRGARRRGWLVRGEGDAGAAVVELDDEAALDDLPPDLALSRLDELGGDERELLRVAAVLGSTFDLTHAAAMVGRPAVSLVGTVEHLVDLDLLVAHGSRLGFRHDLVREAVYDEIAAWARAALHAHAAAVLRDGGAPDGDVAHHLLRGEPVVGTETTGAFHRAGQALLHTDPAAARALLARAVELHPDPADGLVADLVLATTWAGDPGAGERLAREHLARPDPATPAANGDAPVAAAGAADDVSGVRHALAHNLMAQGRLGDAATELEALGAGRGAEERRRCLAEAALVRALAFQHDAAARATDELLADGGGDGPTSTRRARRTDAPVGEVATCVAWCTRSWLDAQAGRAADAVDAAERAIDAAAGSTAALRFHPHYFLALAQLGADRFYDFDASAAEGRALSARLGTVWQLPVWSSTITAKHVRAGDWDKALAEAEVGLGWAAATGSRVGVPWLWCHQAVVALWRGDLDRAQDLLVRAEDDLGTDLRPGVDGVLWVRGLVAEARGDQEAALRSLGPLWDLVEGLGVVARMPTIGPDVVRVALAAGDRPRAARVVDAFDRHHDTPGPASFHAGATRCRGLLAADADLLVGATSRYEGSPAVVEAAMADAEAAQALTRAGEGERAGPHARAALDRFDRMGATLLRQRLEEALGDALGPTGARSVDPRSVLSPAELRVAGLVAAGASNPEVAAALHVSRRTVESHLSHIFTKLGIRSRVDLAVLLADQR